MHEDSSRPLPTGPDPTAGGPVGNDAGAGTRTPPTDATSWWNGDPMVPAAPGEDTPPAAGAPEPGGSVPWDAGEPDMPTAAVLVSVVERLAAIEATLTDFHRRADHREAVIDRLHEERLEQRSGVRRALLDPIVTDLIRLYDGLSAESERMSGGGDSRTSNLLASFADDVELALERCGFDLVRPQPGDRFQSGAQLAASVVPTDDPARHNTVAEVTQVGVLERDTGRVRRPARTRVFRSRRPGSEGSDATEASPATPAPPAPPAPTAPTPPSPAQSGL
ncbi:hypothetical protein BBK14_21360 [Parafrankia soli]|uniref:Nucleotide exchange factor GrpE n=1 Tax=Parafrankia soli TaxID=2599596 RepID=A0A1S1PYI6_9ACTN|nr:hypothetical protein [Parafrankia soli]OHV26379.1 hypothetical protein BBK14_21360 [Parafrankia soli]